MREILFRGKDIRGNWHIGLLAHIGNAWYISNKMEISTAYEVIPNTIGQYTGLTDKNGKKIFEGDIIKACFKPQLSGNPPYAIGSVIFDNGTFKVVVRVSKNSTEYKVFEKEDIAAYSIEHNFLDRYYVLEVIGNTYDNPKLLEVEE